MKATDIRHIAFAILLFIYKSDHILPKAFIKPFLIFKSTQQLQNNLIFISFNTSDKSNPGLFGL